MDICDCKEFSYVSKIKAINKIYIHENESLSQ